jgi:Na+/H+ antiporter NhaD/arsenite permease-like protein
MDNVLAVAMFLPVVSSIGAAGAHAFPLWWAMLFAGTFFGNLTLIGSTANIVAVGILEREKSEHISFLEWIRAGALVSIPTLGIALLLLILQMPLMPR